ncbi:MAG: OmpA/MotB family protein [Acidothermaceae bacterium]
MSSTRPARRRRPVEEEEHEANHERWLLTYADMITLLMVLFIVLFAISVVDKKKFAELADGLSHNLDATTKVLPAGTGVMDGGNSPVNDQGQLAGSPPGAIAPVPQVDLAQPISPEQAQELKQDATKQNLLKQEQQSLAEAEKQIEAALQAKGLTNSAKLQITSRGLVVSIVTDQVLFDTGQAELKPVGQQVLDAVAPALRNLPNEVSVEGYTDNVPITGGPFQSNWELSAVRATTVLRYLVANDGLPASRLSATGYADTRPIVPNDSPAHQQQNRRVEVVVLSTLLTADGSTATDSSTTGSTALHGGSQ